MGKAVITSDFEDIRHVLSHEKSAILINPEDPSALSKAVERLYQDKSLRDKIGSNAGKDISQYDWERINNMMMEHLIKLIRKKEKRFNPFKINELN